jgi:hypothetical protein
MNAVIWRDSALEALADAFVLSDLPTQDNIERIVKGLNARLLSDPHTLGESRGGQRRIAYRAPCAISFLIDDSSGIVRVTHFWTF